MVRLGRWWGWWLVRWPTADEGVPEIGLAATNIASAYWTAHINSPIPNLQRTGRLWMEPIP